MYKLGSLDLPNEIYNWLTHYFHKRGHITKHSGILSAAAEINASVVQGSGIGSGSYNVGASDLHPLHDFNVMLKYADDTYLIVGSNNISTATAELDHVSIWAKENNLCLNSSKTREMIVFKRGRSRIPLPPRIVPGAERVDSIRVLGVTISSELSMTPHLTEVVSSCASSMYALRVLRSHGLPPSAIQQVARMTTVATLMYASPAWWGYTQASDRARMEQLVNKLKRCGFLPTTAPTVQQMAAKADDSLFRAVITNESHVLRSFLPESRSHSYNLRTRVHGYKLPPKDDRNFIPRMLYKNIY